jgi:asparagine synthase (glutamine-hydrolysing)
MFHIAALAVWNDGAGAELSLLRAQRALATAKGTATHGDLLPGAFLGVVAYGAAGGEQAGRIAIDKDAKIAVVASSRLDNIDELTAELGSVSGHGHAAPFLAAYRRWGREFPVRFKGDFSGIVWDWGRRRLLGFRDRIGVRPLFYTARGGTVAVASDVELLLSLVGDGGSPDDQMIVEYLTWQFQSVDRTFWNAARRLPAGHLLSADAGGVRVQPLWRPPDLVARDRTSVYEDFRGLFFRSVSRRLASNSPVLTHLSGGIDSSAIVCVADRIRAAEPDRFPPVRTVSARYPGLDTDEGQYIEAVTRSVSLPSESWDGRNGAFLDVTEPSIAGPGYRSHRADGTMGEFAIAERLGARSILSGQGGDQLGAPSGLSEHLARSQPLWFGWRILSPDGLSSAERVRRVKFLMRAIAPGRLNDWWTRRRARRDAPVWLHPRWRDLVGDVSVPSGQTRGPFRSRVQEAHWRDLLGGAMAHSLDADHRIATRRAVEMRYPYLDDDLVDFVLTLSPNDWPLPDPYARLQRTALRQLLPEAVRARTAKAVFSPVVATRMRNAEVALRALFHEGPWASDRWVSRGAAQALFDRAIFATRDADWGDWQAVRAIATLEAWLRRVFGYDARSLE